MTHSSRLTALSLGLFAAAFARPVEAQQGLLPFLPEDTIAVISAPNLEASMAKFANMPMAKIWHEEEVQNFVADGMEMLQEQIQMGMSQAEEMHAQGMLPVDPAKLMELRVRGVTLAITQLGIEMGDFGPMPAVGLMAYLDFGDTAQQWNGLVRMGLGMLEQEAGDDVVFEESEVGGNKIITLAPAMAPPDFGMAMNVALVDGGILIGTITDEVKATVQAMVDGKHRLSATETYKANRKHLMTDGAELEAYMRPDKAWDFAIEALGMAAQMERELSWLDTDGLARALDALGFMSIKSMATASAYKEGKAVTTSFAVAPAPDRKGLLAVGNSTLDLSFLRWVPKDAVSFSGVTMAPMSLYDSIVAGMRAYDPEVADMAMAQLGLMEDKVGFKLRDDLFGAMGDTMITWSMPMASMMSAPEMAILLKVQDQKKIVKVLGTMTEMSDGMVELEESERRGVTTYQLRINFDPGAGMGMGMNPLDMFNPSFAFKDGYMVMGFSPSDIRRAFKRMDRKEDADPKRDMRGNKEFATYMGQFPEEISSLAFTDWKASFESGYQMVASMMAFLPMDEDIPIDMSMLPDASTMTQHLFGSLYYSQIDGSGIASTSISPFGPETLVAVGLLAGVGGFMAVWLQDSAGF